MSATPRNGGGSYAQMYEERVVHLRDTPLASTPQRRPQSSAQQRQQPQRQQQQQQQSREQPTGAATARASRPSDNASAQPADVNTAARSKPLQVGIPGFWGMDSDTKNAAGSGGEKTLRHRMFPMHDIPQDGDPHRPMLKTAHNPSIDAERAKMFTGINVLNEAYVAPQPMYNHAPPPRKEPTEFDRLMAPEIYREQIDQPSERHSTKHHPTTWDPKQGSPSKQALTARDIATKPLVGSVVDPHQQAYNETFGRSGSKTQRSGIRTGYYDPSKPNAVVGEVTEMERRRGTKQVPEYMYTSSTLGTGGIGTVGPPTAINYSAAGSGIAGVVQPTRSEALDTRARLDGQGVEYRSHESARGGADPRARESDSAGVRTYGVVDKRPGAKAIRAENVNLRMSNQVAEALKDSSVENQRADQDKFKSVGLNLTRRQRDFGQNQPYDIITLNGAGGETGRGFVAPELQRDADPSAGRSSRSQQQDRVGPNRPWAGIGGPGYSEARRNGPVQTSGGYGVAPNQISHLDNTFKVARNADSRDDSGRIHQQYGTGRNVGTGWRNNSSDIWNLMAPGQ